MLHSGCCKAINIYNVWTDIKLIGISMWWQLFRATINWCCRMHHTHTHASATCSQGAGRLQIILRSGNCNRGCLDVCGDKTTRREGSTLSGARHEICLASPTTAIAASVQPRLGGLPEKRMGAYMKTGSTRGTAQKSTHMQRQAQKHLKLKH